MRRSAFQRPFEGVKHRSRVIYYFLTQTFFLGGTSPQRTCSVGRGRSKCPSYHPPTPYTLSPLLKSGGRGIVQW
jgi:hypothetical protein